jgi:sugar lactone lactonase YvrE
MTKLATVHVSGLGFPEGPVALPDGGIAFVDLLHAKVRAYDNGTLREIAALPGAPNGMRLGPDGALYITNNGGIAPRSIGALHFAKRMVSGRIQRLTLDGRASDFAVDPPGEKPSRPNDLVFTTTGDIVFTDPQNWETLHGDVSAYHGGQLLLARPDGTVAPLAKMTGFPNGLAFHPDGSLLVGITMEHRIVRFPWHGDHVGVPSTWCQLDDGFNPDGMVFAGNTLYATGSVGDRVAMIDPTGRVVDFLDTGKGSDPTNVCVHAGRLWVTFGLAGKLVSYPL